MKIMSLVFCLLAFSVQAAESKEALAIGQLGKFTGEGSYRGYEPKTLLPCTVMIDVDKTNWLYLSVKPAKKSTHSEEELNLQSDDFNEFLKTTLKSITETEKEVKATVDETPIDDDGDKGKTEEKHLVLKKYKGKLYHVSVNGVACQKLTKIKSH